MEKVTVIVPVYQVEPYLRQCVDSILEQTYRNIQVILVDDGSPDNCGAICDDYARQDGRVLSLHKPNGGVSSARNFALQYVKGEYLAFCDSDDLFAPDWIETLVTACETTGADVCVGNYIKLLEDGSYGDCSQHETGMEILDQDCSKSDYIFNKLLTGSHGWEIWTRLFRTEIVIREKILFCETCRNYAEDLGFTLTYMLFANRVTSVETSGYRYRIRSGSMMNTSAYNPKLSSLQAVCVYCRPMLLRAFGPDTREQVYGNLQFYLLGNQFIDYLWTSGMEPDVFREYVISDTPDWKEMEREIRKLLKKKKILGHHVSKSRRAEIIVHLDFLSGMPWTILRIQCKLIRMFRTLLDYKVRLPLCRQ